MFLSLQVFAFERQNMTFTVNELLTCFINCDAGPGEIVTRRSRISANSLWVLLPYPNWFFLSFQEWQTDCLIHNFTRRSLRGGPPSFVSVAWFKWQTSLPKIGVSQINPPKQTSWYLIYLANLFLNQSMKRLFRWKQISPPLKLGTLIATFWVPETTKRPRCITVSENGSF